MSKEDTDAARFTETGGSEAAFLSWAAKRFNISEREIKSYMDAARSADAEVGSQAPQKSEPLAEDTDTARLALITSIEGHLRDVREARKAELDARWEVGKALFDMQVIWHRVKRTGESGATPDFFNWAAKRFNKSRHEFRSHLDAYARYSRFVQGSSAGLA